MMVLGIETSCDETALSVVESHDGKELTVLADRTLSQIELHKQFGGVFPMMAKREHSRNLVPVLKTVLQEAARMDLRFKIKDSRIDGFELFELNAQRSTLNTLLEREQELLEQFLALIPAVERPPLDVIAVTEGPGLEPCLWTGINFAKALGVVWNVPVIPANHMEGHIVSALLRAEISSDQFPISKQTTNYKLQTIDFPAVALLISGGHTELVLVRDWFSYKLIGQTRDDAVGEAFDKVARLLGLPYPGGPEISKLAEQARLNCDLQTANCKLPRPMRHSGDFDFSFSGLKTAVLYLLKKIGRPNEKTRRLLAREFEDAVTDVLVEKTRRAAREFGARSLILGGGVSANANIRRSFEQLSREVGVPLLFPEPRLATDNAVMIAAAGSLRYAAQSGRIKKHIGKLTARGGARLDEKKPLCKNVQARLG